MDPDTGVFASHQAVPNGTCIAPSEFPLFEAQEISVQMSQRSIDTRASERKTAARWGDDAGPDVPSVWGDEIAPNPCPQCGRKMFANDLDFCHATNREGTAFVAACKEHNFGCGHEVLGTSFEDAMARWNGQIP